MAVLGADTSKDIDQGRNDACTHESSHPLPDLKVQAEPRDIGVYDVFGM